MAQYVFDARKYPVGTLLSDLGWWINDAGHDFEVVPYWQGANYWRATNLSVNSLMTSKTLHTEYEVLVVCRDKKSGYRPIPTKHGFKYHPTVTQVGGVIPDMSYLEAYQRGYNYTQQDVSYLITITKNDEPAETSESLPISTRVKVQADGTFAQKIWFKPYDDWSPSVEASEPVDWNVEGTTGLPANTPFAVTTPSTFGAANTDAAMFTYISVGTDGDVAPYPDVSLVLTTPTVQVTDVMGTSATVSWS